MLLAEAIAFVPVILVSVIDLAELISGQSFFKSWLKKVIT